MTKSRIVENCPNWKSITEKLWPRHDWRPGHKYPHCEFSYRLGRMLAGRLLDGRAHDEFPNTKEMTA